jgi:hypothetical protein
VNAPPLVLAADLVPWWFALAFWVALVVLAVVVVRDVHRAGGPRRMLATLQRAIESRAAPPPRDGDHGGPPRADP